MPNTSHAASSFALPSVQAGFHYVLILEWLDDQDLKTGSELHRHLQSIGMRSDLVVCASPSDIHSGIKSALNAISVRGRPIIHIEAHGTSPGDVRMTEMAFGRSDGVGLEWADLGDWLAPLNAACDFRAMVVGATCWGLGAISALKVNEHVAPFAACAGFSTSVAAGSVRDAMMEFYSSIGRGDPIRAALANASRGLQPGEKFELTTAQKLAYQVLRGVYDEIRTPNAISAKVNKLLGKARKLGLPITDEYATAMPALLNERTRVRAQEAWDCWFPSTLQEHDSAYRLDWSVVERELTPAATN